MIENALVRIERQLSSVESLLWVKSGPSIKCHEYQSRVRAV
jgi:hypothetical protein